ncbi:uncharacterized protein LOC119325566 [Triticum dicoccoides]|uniref:DUF7895 domain-containing protein n=1 Tax=Triticum turgidum subsp. durum TaxID=4567 RepID=A0A9R0YCL5_TRITD|nr:uncharacterized protein LOC119325566 [Triticum dicoccoides]VAI52944.1 unnamed protein product [Triticum turgidum subsp. durum]
MAMAMAAAAASPSCSPPPWPASSSSSCSLLYTATTARPAASPSARRLRRPRALPETALVAAGVAAAGVAAAVLLRGDRKAEQPAPTEKQEASEECSACGGSGLCPRCKGEGFVFKEVGEEAAGRARRAAKNMATRYTAGLPTKWTYCTRCSSTRSCTACDGSGAVPVRAKTTTTTN